MTFAAALAVWARIAALSFGGPAGQIAVMHRILVEERRWIGEARFLHALSYCTLLPGPEAQQLATYVGWLMHRTRGGVAAGVLFVLPGLVSIMALSVVYALYGRLGPVAALFFGLKSAVLAIVLQAVVRLGRRALRGRIPVAIAAASFAAIFFAGVPFPVIVIVAGVVGWLGARRPRADAGGAPAGFSDADSLLGARLPAHAQPGQRGPRRAAAVCAALWLLPVAVLVAAGGGAGAFPRIALFFSEMALVTFGGAYAALAYVAQEAVSHYHWLQPGEMLDGLGMAETTPGPLIMVLQFVGFLAAYRDPGGLPPLLAGVLGGLLATWVTFVPCFLWIFLGAPYVERLRGNAALAGALAAITAAVVGVILNLAVWFALHAWFRAARPVGIPGLAFDVPVLGSVDPWAVALSAAALFAVFGLRAGMVATLAGCAAAGLALHLALGVV